MSITYFLSVYSSLTARNAFAHELHQLTNGTDDAVELIRRLLDRPDPWAARAQLAAKADGLRAIHQTHRFYPVLRYFHYRRPFYELPQILLTALDSASLLEAIVSAPRGLGSRRFALPELGEAALALLQDLAADVPPLEPDPLQEQKWKTRFSRAREVARLAGVDLRQDEGAAFADYVAARSVWQGMLVELASWTMYDAHNDGNAAPLSC